MMKRFTRDDGRTLRVVKGFREQILHTPRISVQPKREWTDDDYRAAAGKKVRESERFVEQFSRLGGTLDGASVLEVGCGAGIDCLLMARHPIRSVVGIDISLPLCESGEKGARTRRLTREVLAVHGLGDSEAALRQLSVRFETMDATAMTFPDDGFDLIWSRAAMEHIIPPELALSEMARVVRPGGWIYHSIDPYYWLKGCHKGGLVDIPWAHARLTAAEYHHFVTESEGQDEAAKRSRHLQTLNQFTPRQWRKTLEAGPFEIVEWKEETHPLAEALLEEHPDVRETRLDGVETGDLTCGQVTVWMRNRAAPTDERTRQEEKQ